MGWWGCPACSALSICLKSSLDELSLDRARSVNTRVNSYHSGADTLAGALLSLWWLSKVQATGSDWHWTSAVVWEMSYIIANSSITLNMLGGSVTAKCTACSKFWLLFLASKVCTSVCANIRSLTHLTVSTNFKGTQWHFKWFIHKFKKIKSTGFKCFFVFLYTMWNSIVNLFITSSIVESWEIKKKKT